MNTKRVRQHMLKRAAGFPWKEWMTNIGSSLGFGGRSNNSMDFPKEEKTRDQAFHDANSHPYDNAKDFEAAGFDPSLAGDKAHIGAMPSMYWTEGRPTAGLIPYKYIQTPAKNNTTGPGWTYKIYDTRPLNPGEGVSRSTNFTIYPEQLPNYRAGRAMREATASYRKQPLNMQQLMAIQAGNNGYLTKLLEHYRSVDPTYWHAANLRLSSPEELEKWKESIPQIGQRSDSSSYNSYDGKITLASDDIRQSGYDYFVNNTGDDLEDSPMFVAKPSKASSGLFHSDPMMDVADAETFFHELNHRNSMGNAVTVDAPYPHGKSIPFGEGGMATLMRPETFKGLYLTPMQIRWLQENDIEPYAVNENEMNQALLSFNAGRYRLRNDMLENPNNPNYLQIDPKIRQQFADFPQFIQPGEAGAKQLNDMLEFYSNNPQFILMMPEQARLVGYYKNLKAAIENSEDPVEKEFFQNIMNRMIYDKAFLANNQQSRPKISYADAYRAYA